MGDPEAMDAKKGLNEWGAFGGGGSGGGAGGPGTFGFGLFHHHGTGGDSGSSEDEDKTPSTSTVSRDPFEIDQLLMGDPISFNPLQAISWAKLDDEPMEEDEGGVGGRSETMADMDVECGNRFIDYSPEQAAGDTSGFQQVRHGDYPVHKIGCSPATSTGSTMMSGEAVQRGRTRNSPYGGYAADHSPNGNVSQTRSTVTLSSQTTEPTDVYNNSSDNNSTVVPAVLPPTGRVSETKGSHGTGSRQQNRERRQRHRQPRETKKSSGAHVVTTISAPAAQHSYPNDPYQQQNYAFPPPPPPPSFASLLPPAFHQPPAVFQPELQYQQQALLPPPPPSPAYGSYAIAKPCPPPGQQQQQQQQQLLLLCLAPNCSARFRCEPELNAHYRAEHSFMCNWASCKSASFTSNNALVWHVKAEHLLLCPVPGCCDRVFSSKKALDGHVRVS